jgi:hypothetical protein
MSVPVSKRIEYNVSCLHHFDPYGILASIQNSKCLDLIEDWLEYPQTERFYKPPKTRKPSENSRHPDLEYDDMQPDEDGLTLSEYHSHEW